MKQKSDKSAKAWDKTAQKYSRSKISDMQGYERSIERAIEYLNLKDYVLEIGCGTGTTGLRYLPYVKRYIGTDISKEMIKICREKLAQTDFKNAEFQVSSASKLSFSNKSFDVVVAHNVLHLVDDMYEALNEMHRVLKPEGRLILKNPCLAEMNVFLRKVIIPVMTRFFGISTLNLFSQEDLRNALNHAGFKVELYEFHATKGKDIRPFIIAQKI